MTHNEAVATYAVEGYLLDEMSEDEGRAFEEHYFDCDECFVALILGLRFISGLKEVSQ